MDRAAFALIGVVGFAVGYVAAILQRPAEDASPALIENDRFSRSPNRFEREQAGPTAERSGAPCSDHLAARELEQVRRKYEGEAVAWPEGISESYKPAMLGTEVDQAIEECGLPLRRVAVSCEEFPCLLVLERLDESDLTDMFLWSCEAWTDTFGERRRVFQAQGQVHTEDGPRRYWITDATPEGWFQEYERDNLSKRYSFRVDAWRERLAIDWEGEVR
jgi:hypothetical protein